MVGAWKGCCTCGNNGLDQGLATASWEQRLRDNAIVSIINRMMCNSVVSEVGERKKFSSAAAHMKVLCVVLHSYRPQRLPSNLRFSYEILG